MNRVAAILNVNTPQGIDTVHVMIGVDEETSTFHLLTDSDDDMMGFLDGEAFQKPYALNPFFSPEEGIRYVVFDANTKTFLPMTNDEYLITEV